MSRKPLDYNLNTLIGQRTFSLSVFLKDPILILSILSLLVFGIVMLYSASGQSEGMVLRQSVYIALGLCIMTGLAQIHPSSYKHLLPNLYWVGLFLLIYVLIFPDESHLTKRWIDLGFMSFQPSEIVRLILPLSIASFLTRNELNPSFSDWIISIAAVSLCSFLIFRQPDLGTSLIVFMSGFLPIFLTGFPISIILIFVTLIGISSPILYNSLNPYMQQRILTLFDPDSDPLGTGWNIAQSKTAIGSGGFFGKGYLEGTQSQLDFIPESHSDFIFAVIGEELGLIGILFLFSLYALIIYRIFSIGYSSDTVFTRLVCCCIGFIFFIFLMINISMVIGIIPVVGVPLPLVSQGGTSLVVHLIAFGFVLSMKKRSDW